MLGNVKEECVRVCVYIYILSICTYIGLHIAYFILSYGPRRLNSLEPEMEAVSFSEKLADTY
jgi:hypothetical protein